MALGWRLFSRLCVQTTQITCLGLIKATSYVCNILLAVKWQSSGRNIFSGSFSMYVCVMHTFVCVRVEFMRSNLGPEMRYKELNFFFI